MVDEFQDTSEKQWLFLQQLGAAAQVIALGDPNQIIYSSLHSATERRLEEFAAWKGVQADRSLTCNHRCSQAKILEFAGCLLTATRFDLRNSGPVKFGKMYRNQLRAELALLWKRIQDKIGGGNGSEFYCPPTSWLRMWPQDCETRLPARECVFRFTHRSHVMTLRTTP